MKITILFICLFLSISFLSGAQTVTKLWDSSYGGGGYEFLFDALLFPDGSFLLGGYSRSAAFGDKTSEKCYNNDWWIVKTNATGVMQWDNTLGNHGTDFFYAADVTSDGGAILGGYVQPASGNQCDFGNHEGMAVAKVDHLGQLQWTAGYELGGQDFVRDIKQTPDGGYILGGTTKEGIGPYKSEPSKGGSDFWLLKIDDMGNKEWDKTLGGPKHQELIDILLTNDGGYLVAGNTKGPAGFDVSTDGYGNSDYWIIKTDASGTKLWDKRFGGSQFDGFTDVVQTPDGGFLLGGSSLSSLSPVKSEPNKGLQDYWIIKIDANGNIQWDRTIGGSEDDELMSLVVTADSGYLLCGFTPSGISGDKTQPSQGGRDYWMVKVDPSGTILWDASFGGSLDDFLISAVLVSEHTVLLAGASASPISGDKKSKPVNDSRDYWIVKVAIDDEFQLKEREQPELSLSSLQSKTVGNENPGLLIIYPNPFSSSATISFSLEQNSHTTIDLFDLAGRKIGAVLDENLEAGNHEVQLNRGQLSAGIYFLRVKTPSSSVIQQLIVN